jgi:hypothetical protein
MSDKSRLTETAGLDVMDGSHRRKPDKPFGYDAVNDFHRVRPVRVL